MNKFELNAIFNLVYWFAVGSIQTTDRIELYAKELHRLADCLLKDKAYKPDLKPFGW